MQASRRRFVQSLSLGAGGALLAPVVGRILADADGEPAPRRFVFVLQSNGFQPWAAQPKGLERTEEGPDKVTSYPLMGYELPDDLVPLDPWRHRMTIVQGLTGKHTTPWHSGGFSALSGTPRKRPEQVARGETIDAALAKALPAPVPLVNVGILNRPIKGTENGRYACCSAWAADRPIDTQMEPELAYQALFGMKYGTKLVDGLNQEAKRAAEKLAGEEREKSGQYLDAFESIGARSAAVERLESMDRSSLQTKDRSGYASSVEAQRLAAQFDNVAAALIGGLTNVATICSGGCDTNGMYEGVGADVSLHPLGHKSGSGGRTWQELYTVIRRHHLELVAGLIRRLESVKEGDGTMFDNTLIVYTSDGADAHHSKGSEWPFVLIGHLGRRLQNGMLFDYPRFGRHGSRTINALYSTLLHAAGAPRDRFNLDGEAKDLDKPGPLDELLA